MLKAENYTRRTAPAPVPHLSGRHACLLSSILISLFIAAQRSPRWGNDPALSSADREPPRKEGTRSIRGIYHALVHYADFRIRLGTSWSSWCHHGYVTSELESEHHHGLQHHVGDLADAGPLDGLHLVQLGRLQLHPEVLRPGTTSLSSDSTDYHGALLPVGDSWALAGSAGT